MNKPTNKKTPSAAFIFRMLIVVAFLALAVWLLIVNIQRQQVTKTNDTSSALSVSAVSSQIESTPESSEPPVESFVTEPASSSVMARERTSSEAVYSTPEEFVSNEVVTQVLKDEFCEMFASFMGISKDDAYAILDIDLATNGDKLTAVYKYHEDADVINDDETKDAVTQMLTNMSSDGCALAASYQDLVHVEKPEVEVIFILNDGTELGRAVYTPTATIDRTNSALDALRASE